MPTTGVSVAFAAFLAAALLGRQFDRRSVAVVLFAAALPDLDVLAGYIHPTLHNAVLHSVFWPALAVGLLYYDLHVRETSWLRARYGARGVRVAWVSLTAFVFAGIGMDLLNIEGAAALWPVDDTFYSLVGRVAVTNKEGFVQTFVHVDFSGSGPLLSVGTHRAAYAPRLPVDAHTGTFIFTVVESGWQLLFLLAAPVVLAARAWLPAGAPTRTHGIPDATPDGVELDGSGAITDNGTRERDEEED